MKQKTDYQDELDLLPLIWTEKLLKENYELYEKYTINYYCHFFF